MSAQESYTLKTITTVEGNLKTMCLEIGINWIDLTPHQARDLAKNLCEMAKISEPD